MNQYDMIDPNGAATGGADPAGPIAALIQRLLGGQGGLPNFSFNPAQHFGTPPGGHPGNVAAGPGIGRPPGPPPRMYGAPGMPQGEGPSFEWGGKRWSKADAPLFLQWLGSHGVNLQHWAAAHPQAAMILGVPTQGSNFAAAR